MKYTIILLNILLLVGCASVGVTRLKASLAKPQNCNLDVFTAESEIKQSFEVICLLDSKTASNAFADKTMAGAINLAKPKACECGADGILISGGRSEGVSAFAWGQGYAIIKAIRYVK